MRKFLIAVAALLFAGSAHAGVLPAGGGLVFQLATLPGLVATGGGAGIVPGSGAINTLVFAGGGFGPVTASVPVTSSNTINSVVFTNMRLTGTRTLIAGGVALPNGLAGTAKICLVFAPCAYSSVTVPLTPTAGGGFGVGGTQVIPGGVSITMQHNAWTLGVPTMTIHTAGSNVTTPTFPGGGLFPGTQVPGGVVQLVTVTKTYTSLTTAFPELPLIGIIQLQFIPEPGTLLLLGSGVVGLAILGRKRARK